MKYYVEKDGVFFNLVVIKNNEIAAATHIQGQNIGAYINKLKGVDDDIEQLVDLPSNIQIKDGVLYCQNILTGEP